jgi:hypothetical protein
MPGLSERCADAQAVNLVVGHAPESHGAVVVGIDQARITRLPAASITLVAGQSRHRPVAAMALPSPAGGIVDQAWPGP